MRRPTPAHHHPLHHRPAIGPLPGGATNFSPDALRRLLATTQITGAESYVSHGRSVEDYRGSIWMYLLRYTQTGDLTSLAKAVLKTVSLRSFLAQHYEATEPEGPTGVDLPSDLRQGG